MTPTISKIEKSLTGLPCNVHFLEVINYVSDISCVVSSKAEGEQIMDIISEYGKNPGLVLNKHKTRIMVLHAQKMKILFSLQVL